MFRILSVRNVVMMSCLFSYLAFSGNSVADDKTAPSDFKPTKHRNVKVRHLPGSAHLHEKVLPPPGTRYSKPPVVDLPGGGKAVRTDNTHYIIDPPPPLKTPAKTSDSKPSSSPEKK